MKSIASVRLRAGLIAFALVLSQVVMPVQSAFATPGGDKEPKSDEPKKVYVCKYVGTPGENERLQTGQNPIEVSHNAVGDTAPGSYFNDRHDRSFVLGYVIKDQPAPSITLCPGVVDVAKISVSSVPVCGPNNDTLTIMPASVQGVTFTQTAWADGSLTVTATLGAGYEWSDRSTTLTKTFTLIDAATVCERPVTVPTPLSTDPCGAQNATWATQMLSAEYTWSVQNGRLIVIANPGFYFMVQGQRATSYDFGLPVDANLLCPVVPPCVVSSGSKIVSKDSEFADSQDTRSKGHYSFTNDGLKIYTEDTSSESKVAWYKNVNYPLSQVGTPSMDYASVSGQTPGLQIVVDFDGNGTPDGILVGESIYGNNWWLSNSAAAFVKAGAPHNGGGYGSQWYGTLSEWYASFQSAQVKSVGFSLGSGVKAEGVLKSLTFGCYTWYFKRVASVCTVTNNMYDRVWSYDGTNYPEAGAYPEGTPGSFDFQNEGLYLNTPTVESYVSGFMDGGNTPLADVDAMSYKVLRQTKSAGFDATLPAYILSVDTNGLSVAGGQKYFFYEPYNNDQSRAAVEGTFQTWDALNGGNAKWYMSGTGQTLKTWSSFVSQFPDAVVLSYGFNQGTYNAETYSVVQDIKFDCATTMFRYFQGNGGVGGETPTTPTTPVTPTTSTPVAVQGSGSVAGELPAELPMTGNGGMLTTWFALLAAILTYGAVLYLQPKKRAE